MTNKEALEILKTEWDINAEIFDTIFHEALAIAIKALEEREERIKKLKSCPFCGEQAHFKVMNNFVSHHGVGFNFTVECSSCGATRTKTGSIVMKLDEQGVLQFKDDARNSLAEAWNDRREVPNGD